MTDKDMLAKSAFESVLNALTANTQTNTKVIIILEDLVNKFRELLSETNRQEDKYDAKFEKALNYLDEIKDIIVSHKELQDVLLDIKNGIIEVKDDYSNNVCKYLDELKKDLLSKVEDIYKSVETTNENIVTEAISPVSEMNVLIEIIEKELQKFTEIYADKNKIERENIDLQKHKSNTEIEMLKIKADIKKQWIKIVSIIVTGLFGAGGLFFLLLKVAGK